MAVRVKITPKARRALLRSDEVRSDVASRARAVAQAAGPGYESDSDVGRNRARGMVWTDTPEAIRREAKRPRLLGALDAGR